MTKVKSMQTVRLQTIRSCLLMFFASGGPVHPFWLV
jgi:hypothetical protein